MEQAWMQYDIANWLQFRGGAVLVPLGRFNINHDDNRWDLPRRSLVDRGTPVLPTTAAWPELGAGFLGDIPIGNAGKLSYQAYVMNGVTLDSEVEQIGLAPTNINLVLVNRAQSSLQIPWQEAEQILNHEMTAIISPAPELAFQAAEAGFPIVLFQPYSIVANQFSKLGEEIAARRGVH